MAHRFKLEGWVEDTKYLVGKAGTGYRFRAMVCPRGKKLPLGRSRGLRADKRCGWGHGNTAKSAIKDALENLSRKV